jgi:putative MFS transporter
MLAAGVGMGPVFVVFASVFVIVSAVVLGLGIESRQKSLEAISGE